MIDINLDIGSDTKAIHTRAVQLLYEVTYLTDLIGVIFRLN